MKGGIVNPEMFEKSHREEFLFENPSWAWCVRKERGRKDKPHLLTGCSARRTSYHPRLFSTHALGYTEDASCGAWLQWPSLESTNTLESFPLFSGQLSSQWEAKWGIWSALHLLLPWAIGTWVAGTSPNKQWRWDRAKHPRSRNKSHSPRWRQPSGKDWRSISPRQQWQLDWRHPTLSSTEKRTPVVKESPASNSEGSPGTNGHSTQRGESPYEDRERPPWDALGSAECLPKQLITSHLPSLRVDAPRKGAEKQKHELSDADPWKGSASPGRSRRVCPCCPVPLSGTLTICVLIYQLYILNCIFMARCTFS